LMLSGQGGMLRRLERLRKRLLAHSALPIIGSELKYGIMVALYRAAKL
jgi:hypothetical protein